MRRAALMLRRRSNRMCSMIQPAVQTTSVIAAVAQSAPKRIYNFSAGPSFLPEEVIKQAQHDIWSIDGSGMGIMEHSHRAPVYDKVLADAEADFAAISNMPKNFKVMFLVGGATSQNYMVPANLLGQNETADYITTGYWAERSFEHAQLYGHIHEAYSGKSTNYRSIPRDSEIKYSAKPTYVHICSNNTIYGTQWHELDASGKPTWNMRTPKIPDGAFLVCDMCSDIYCRPIDWSKYGVVYAGAQKNLGVAGTTVVAIREDLLERRPRELPEMLQYRVQVREHSRMNTPPVFPIYLCGQMFKWILRQGGLDVIQQRNVAKAHILYSVLDQSKFYQAAATPESRSLMNVVFRTPTAALDDLFVKQALEAGMDNIKGHRATGGMRVSIYNAMPDVGAKAMADFMREFERKNG